MHSSPRAGFRSTSGVTLVELLVTLAVLAILATLSAPALSEIMWSSRLTAQADKIVTSLQRARSEAIYRRQPTGLKGFADNDSSSPCTSSKSGGFDWTNLTTFVDANHRHDKMPLPNAGSAYMILERSSVQRNNRYGQEDSAAPLFRIYSNTCAIAFHSDGMPRAVSTSGGEAMRPIEVIVCRPEASPAQNARRIQMTAGGRIRVVPVNGEGRCPELTSAS